MEKKRINIFFIIRLLVGAVFLVSGAEKLLSPYQNFLYVVQGYSLFLPFFEELTARIFPWIEFILGIFTVLGLNLFWSLRGILFCLVGFILIISQAILRNLPIEECGCFGSLVSVPITVTLVFDSCLFLLTLWMVINVSKTSFWGLDQIFQKDG